MLLVAAGIAAAVIYLAGLAEPLIAALIGLNVGSLMLCGYDKMQAQAGRLRIPEVVLYAAALAGGALGLLAGMKLFRHKTAKASFQFYLLLILTVQIVVLKSLIGSIRP
ncbi:MAG: DUF1294 domain-containing protein [Oligoflexia bacterium]|nr:DUF1294 domain-containing protein [Oligoflexia bacterium]